MIAFLLGLMPVRGWLIAGAAVLALGGIAYEVHHLKSQGAADAVQQIDKANADAQSKALDGKDKALQDYDTCVANGGVWVRAELVCHPAGSR